MFIPTSETFSCEAERPRLRPLEAGDEALFHALYTNPETMRYIDEPWTPVAAAERFRKAIRRQGKSPLCGRFLVILGGNAQAPLGICGMSHYDPVAMRIEVGMVLLREGRRSGIGRGSLTALVDLAFEEEQVNEVYARFAPRNAAARNLVARIGFEPSRAVNNGEQTSIMSEYSVSRSIWCIYKTTNIQG